MDGKRPHLPIVALTANAIKGDRRRAWRRGMDDYVTKPIDVSMLKKAIEGAGGC